MEPNTVFCATSPQPHYEASEPRAAPELLEGEARTPAEQTVRELLRQTQLDGSHFGSPEWNPFSELIGQKSKVLIKPNWVFHKNLSGAGLESLVTHPSVIAAIMAYVVKAKPQRIVVGDAPIQGCDFDLLRAACNLDELIQSFQGCGVECVLDDFRRTILPNGRFGSQSQLTARGEKDYIVFDLGRCSDLEPITDGAETFRVTMYDPDALNQTHAPGKHQYLVAREVIEADIVFNVPKLKTHQKAGVTGALKNLVGINGLKDYLPHHRKGGSRNGGDCYEGGSRIKALTEHLLDAANRTKSAVIKPLLVQGARVGSKLATFLGEDRNLEGSWHGNDTVWRMCLDLQRIVLYGRPDGTLDSRPQRRVITITDAIIAGEGEGPLAPTPIPLGLMTMGENPPALEWVHALLMGLDPRSIPLIRQSFAAHPYPIASFTPDEIIIKLDGERLTPAQLVAARGQQFRPPRGWAGHCELSRER